MHRLAWFLVLNTGLRGRQYQAAACCAARGWCAHTAARASCRLVPVCRWPVKHKWNLILPLPGAMSMSRSTLLSAGALSDKFHRTYALGLGAVSRWWLWWWEATAQGHGACPQQPGSGPAVEGPAPSVGVCIQGPHMGVPVQRSLHGSRTRVTPRLAAGSRRLC